jgi:hypothetical protein
MSVALDSAQLDMEEFASKVARAAGRAYAREKKQAEVTHGDDQKRVELGGGPDRRESADAGPAGDDRAARKRAIRARYSAADIRLDRTGTAGS